MKPVFSILLVLSSLVAVAVAVASASAPAFGQASAVRPIGEPSWVVRKAAGGACTRTDGKNGTEEITETIVAQPVETGYINAEGVFNPTGISVLEDLISSEVECK